MRFSTRQLLPADQAGLRSAGGGNLSKSNCTQLIQYHHMYEILLKRMKI